MRGLLLIADSSWPSQASCSLQHAPLLQTTLFNFTSATTSACCTHLCMCTEEVCCSGTSVSCYVLWMENMVCNMSVVGWRCPIMNHGFVRLWQLGLIFFFFFLLGHQGTYSRNLCDAFPAGFAHPGYCVGGISAHWQWCSQYGVALW